MARWEPDARGRLQKAAMELFQERGYEQTTVEDIAARAGLTERTFFRHFPDKREVLFSGSKDLESWILEGIGSAPREAGPLETVTAGFEAAGTRLEGLHEIQFVRARYELVRTHADIQERELIKMAALGVSVTQALRARGIPEPAASLAAEAGVAVFKIGFDRWLAEKKPRDFPGHVRAAMDAFRAMAAEGSAPAARAKKKTLPVATARKA